MNDSHKIYYNSPLGWLMIGASDIGITEIRFVDQVPPKPWSDHHFLIQCKRELDEYFTGQRQKFGVSLDLQQATPFERKVWQQLLQIPYGNVLTYSDVATKINQPKAARAVGKANGDNPISIIIPCHRLIGRDGKLRGYAGGLERKQALLELEHPEVTF